MQTSTDGGATAGGYGGSGASRLPTAVELSAAFKVQPTRAISFFESLGIIPRWSAPADATEAGDLAFYISRVMEMDVLTAVKQELQRAIDLGISQSGFRAFMRGRLAQLGWLGARTVTGPDGEPATVDISTPHRMDVIFRTNAQAAYNAGRYQNQLAQGDASPFWQYLAVNDSRTRRGHRAMSGNVFRFDDPIWATIYPPCGFNCRCRVRTMTEAAFKASGKPLLDGETFRLPTGFPDAGFGYNPGDPGARVSALAQVANDAGTAAHAN